MIIFVMIFLDFTEYFEIMPKKIIMFLHREENFDFETVDIFFAFFIAKISRKKATCNFGHPV